MRRTVQGQALAMPWACFDDERETEGAIARYLHYKLHQLFSEMPADLALMKEYYFIPTATSRKAR